MCPMLLAQECNYCHEKGHTPKYCPKLKAKQQRQQHMSSIPAPMDFNWQSTSGNRTCPPPQPQLRHYISSQAQKFQEPDDEMMMNIRGFVCDGAHSPCASSPPPHAYPPLSTLRPRRSTPMRVGVAIPSHVHIEMQQQHENEEFVSAWAGRSTAYTLEEEAIAEAEMEEEAEFQWDFDIFHKQFADDGSSTHSSMPSLEDCTWG